MENGQKFKALTSRVYKSSGIGIPCGEAAEPPNASTLRDASFIFFQTCNLLSLPCLFKGGVKDDQPVDAEQTKITHEIMNRSTPSHSFTERMAFWWAFHEASARSVRVAVKTTKPVISPE